MLHNERPQAIDEAAAEANEAINEAIRQELYEQGFPGYISYSFLETAKTTNSVILSRVPGGVGVDLIEEGYDLKGFHIKAKSCNWGPMAGFICQLPVFNKQGVARVGYNTEQIGYYLKGISHFSKTKHGIEAIRAQEAVDIENIVAPTDVARKVEEDKIKAKADKAVLELLLAERETESKSGHWSGENEIDHTSPSFPLLPFLPLRRKFENVEAVRKMRGVRSAISLSNTMIYGIAENVTDENHPEKSRPTVKMEFLLIKKEGAATWEIRHGRIAYKEKEGEGDFDKFFVGGLIDKLVDDKIKKDYEAYTEKIFQVSPDDPHVLPTKDYRTAMQEVEGAFASVPDTITFSHVNGIINPFPPFKESKDFYKNAVSGDYDLFAIWPSMEVPHEEVIRQSEILIGQNNRLGGKIFTTYIGYKCNFGIEHIPGFGELNPDKSKQEDILKESAEFGNMHSLGHLVSQVLNQNAENFISLFNPEVVSGSNKGFHSDEGGRPGIMEIEFPIAVFMPEEFDTRVLNNPTPAAGKIRVIGERDPITTNAGLIKNIDELVAFIIECMDRDYRVLMHYRWMIHLLYATIDPANYESELATIVTTNIDEIKKYNPKFKSEPAEYLKEFKAINANREVIEEKMEFDADYLLNLKSLLTKAGDRSRFFEKLKPLMLKYAFTANMPSFKRRAEVEKLMDEFQITNTVAI